MSRLILWLPSLLLLVACEMQSVQNRTTPPVNPKFVGNSRFNEQTGQYEIEVKWQGLGEMSYEIRRKTIERDPYNYGGGGIRVISSRTVYASNPTDSVFIDSDVESRLVYEYELLDVETRTFRVGPISVYVYEDRVLTGSLGDHYAIGGTDNRYGKLTVRGAVNVENWQDVFPKQLVFEEGANLIFGNHPPSNKFGARPKTDACIVRRIFAERAIGEVTLTGIDSTCIEGKKTYQGNNFVIQIEQESPVKFVYGKGVASKELPAFTQCILVGQRKVLWDERCEGLLPKQ